MCFEWSREQRAAGKHHWSQTTWLWQSERLSSDSSPASGQIPEIKSQILSLSVPSRWQAFSCHSICTVAHTWGDGTWSSKHFSPNTVGQFLILICTYFNLLESDHYKFKKLLYIIGITLIISLRKELSWYKDAFLMCNVVTWLLFPLS